MAVTTRGFPYADLGDPADAQATTQELADFLDDKGLLYAIDTLANRPAAADAVGTFYLITDPAPGTAAMVFSDGAAWLPVGVTDHGALAGLGDDDHPQYLLRAGEMAAATIERLLQRIDTRRTEHTYVGGQLTQILERDAADTTTLRTTDITYDGSGRVDTVVETVGGLTITTTYTYTAGGDVDVITRAVA